MGSRRNVRNTCRPTALVHLWELESLAAFNSCMGIALDMDKHNFTSFDRRVNMWEDTSLVYLPVGFICFVKKSGVMAYYLVGLRGEEFDPPPHITNDELWHNVVQMLMVNKLGTFNEIYPYFQPQFCVVILQLPVLLFEKTCFLLWLPSLGACAPILHNGGRKPIELGVEVWI